jgi:hypothetical protein
MPIPRDITTAHAVPIINTIAFFIAISPFKKKSNKKKNVWNVL